MLGLICSACSVTRKIPEGQYLLQKVKIDADKSTPRKERITAADFEKYVRQTPNKRFLGTNFYVWLYEQANPGKQNWWNNWKRRIGQEPVLLDMGLTERSAQNLKIFMDSKGFRASQVTFEVDTTSRRKRARVTYRTRQGEPYRIDSVSYEFRDKFLEQIILPDTANTLLRKGGIFDITVLDRERERIAAYLKERGYYNFTVNNIEYVADTLGGGHKVGLELVVKQNLTGYDERGLPVMDNNMVYRIDQINVFPNYDPTVARTDSTFLQRLDTLYYRGLNIVYEKRPNLRPAILRQAVPLYPNYVYNSAQVNRAYTDLMSLGYFKSAKIEFEEQPPECRCHQLCLLYRSIGRFHADPLYAGRVPEMQYPLYPDPETELQGRSGRKHHVELLRAESHRGLPKPQYFPGCRSIRRFVHGRL